MDYLKRTFLGKDDRDFMHAVVPLHSERHMTEAKTTDGASIGEKSTVSQNSGRSTTTLESLRAEIESDVDSEGHNTAYDRTYTLVAGESFSKQHGYMTLRLIL
jgi:hypothetical protein